MKIKEYNNIKRIEYPKWAGWKLLDFYNTISLDYKENEASSNLLSILSYNFILIKRLESLLKF